MAVHVDEMVSEVTAAPDSPAAGAAKQAQWEEQANIRSAQARIARDSFRTAAESYDD